MLFNTVEFVVFAAVVLLRYHHLRHRAQNVMRLAGSYVFSGWWDWRFLALLATSTVVDYAMGRLIEDAHAAARNPIDFALFVSFFPQLVAGPIERASCRRSRGRGAAAVPTGRKGYRPSGNRFAARDAPGRMSCW